MAEGLSPKHLCDKTLVYAHNIAVMNLSEIDRKHWQPSQHATLLFVIQNGKVLLIHKKRGLGAGKINGPGGRIEPGETPEQGAIREVQEELLITPLNVKYAGRLNFQFVDGFSIRGEVFTATSYDGVPTETREAIPIWKPIDQLPFDKMWQDDRLWMPWMFAGNKFDGWFIFNVEELLEYDIKPMV